MQRILICKFPYSSLFGGGEQHTIQLVQGLEQKGFEFFLASSCRVLLYEFRKRKWHAQRWWAGPEPVSRGTLVLWPFTALFAGVSIVCMLVYYRIVRRVTILYCLSLTEKILATVPARMLGMKVLWIEHVTFDRWLTQNPLRYWYRLVSRLVTVVAVSNAVKQQLLDEIHVPARALTVIYSGIDCTKFVMRDRRWEQAARFNIGCVARLEKEKGLEFLIQAVKIIREFVPYVRLIIVGEGSERRKLVWLAERLGLNEAVQWVGRQREIEKWYGYFDAYCLPSVIRESFGITILEAMASGVPVVASRIGGIPEIVTHGVTGLLAEPGSSQSLADQLMSLYNDRLAAKDMSVAARRGVEERFNVDRMIRDFYLLMRR
ncbi:MAG: glycosyltransferase family 4 protein [Patescibacteria group bacterium]|nr:glycosyltransferase family 4 protein [Patescibacteria group bacterium]MDD5715651.1 glycosyltransferase family 4 protein [Patescibacteria group bacterium]